MAAWTRRAKTATRKKAKQRESHHARAEPSSAVMARAGRAATVASASPGTSSAGRARIERRLAGDEREEGHERQHAGGHQPRGEQPDRGRCQQHARRQLEAQVRRRTPASPGRRRAAPRTRPAGRRAAGRSASPRARRSPPPPKRPPPGRRRAAPGPASRPAGGAPAPAPRARAGPPRVGVSASGSGGSRPPSLQSPSGLHSVARSCASPGREQAACPRGRERAARAAGGAGTAPPRVAPGRGM